MARVADQSPRIIFIGDSGVGKTSIIVRAATGAFDPSSAPTVGAGVRPLSVDVDNKSHKFHIWDTAGQEIYRAIVPLYFRQAVAAVVCFGVDDVKSFENIPEWLALLRQNAVQNVPVVLVGNKVDVGAGAKLEVGTAKKWAAKEKLPLFFTSAMTGEGIKELFEHIARVYVAAANVPEETLNRKIEAADDEQRCC